MQRLHQEYIYSESLLGGLRYPTDYLLDAIERAEELFPYIESSPIILPPSLYWGRKVDLKDGEDKGYKWMTLPRVRCIAELFCNRPIRGSNKPFSSALVIWFQDHYGLPNEQVKAQLEELDWPKHAQEWST